MDLQRQFPSIIYSILGFVNALIFSVVVLLSVPIYIFRLIVDLFKPLVRPDLGVMINAQGSTLADDLFSGKNPRANIIVRLTVEGNLSLEQVKNLVNVNWIRKIDPDTGSLLYPEFRQYVTSWMGFYCWKNDNKFNLDNHLKLNSWKDVVTEKDIDNCMEKLLNDVFPLNRSPWEICLVQNYKNTSVSDKPMTCLILKCHHTLCGGHSIRTMLFEGLCTTNTAITMAQPAKYTPDFNLWQLLKTMIIPFQTFFEFSKILSQGLVASPWDIEDEDKQWWQRYAKSERIPIDKIKHIKNTFGVSFTSVIISAISNAICNDFYNRKRTFKGPMLCTSILPSATAPKGLVNQANGTFFNIPTGAFKTPVQSLQACHKILESGRTSMSPLIFRSFYATMGSNLIATRDLLGRNRLVSTGLSNFSTYLQTLYISGCRMRMAEFATGCHQGVTGAAFMSMSYEKHIRICVTAESGVFTKPHVEHLVASVEGHINELYSYTKNGTFNFNDE